MIEWVSEWVSKCLVNENIRKRESEIVNKRVYEWVGEWISK